MINLGLSRITALVAQLPTPRTWKAIHIAGTNGKGSVAAYLSSLFLRHTRPKQPDTQLRIGRFTSPHIIDRWDCITINDLPVSESLFLKVENEVKSYTTKAIQSLMKTRETPQKSSGGYNSNESETVTEFELLTATAFEIFSQQGCQVAIIECGLGGRLDATNVLTSDDVACSVITMIGLDHIGLLGDTLQAIAQEKAGIVKSNVSMVVDGTNPPEVVQAIAADAGTKDVIPSTSDPSEVESTWRLAQDAELSHLPPHQYNNLILALSVFTQSQPRIPSLIYTNYSNNNDQQKQSSTSTSTSSSSILPQLLTDVRKSYPARLQHLDITPLFPNYTRPILLDGAHNPQSAQVLKAYIDNLPQRHFTSSSSSSLNPPQRTWIIAMSKGKDTSSILKILLDRQSINKTDAMIFCKFGPVDGMPWVEPQDPAQLAHETRLIMDLVVVHDDDDKSSSSSSSSSIKQASTVLEALEIATESCLSRRRSRHHHQPLPPPPPHSETMDPEAEKDKEGEEIEIVVAGSLYLASDLLRAIRDATLKNS